MSDLTLAADTYAVDKLVRSATPKPKAPRIHHGTLGPFAAELSLSGEQVVLGPITLRPPVIHLGTSTIKYEIGFRLIADLNRILPRFCLPQVCVDLPFVGRVCSPEVCVEWPAVAISGRIAPGVTFSGSFELTVKQDGPDWAIEIVVKKPDELRFNDAANALILAIGAAATLVLSFVPFIGLLLGTAVILITGAIVVSSVVGLLDDLLSPFVKDRTYTIYRQPRTMRLLSAAGDTDPQVDFEVKALTASVEPDDATTAFVVRADVI